MRHKTTNCSLKNKANNSNIVYYSVYF